MPKLWRRTGRRVFIVFLVLWAVSPSFPGSAPAADRAGEDADAVAILTGPRGGQEYALGEGLANLLRQEGVKARALVGGEVENLRLVGEGKADVGFTMYSFLGATAAGEKELPSVDPDNVVLLTNLYPQVLYVIVRKELAEEHKLRSLGDLLKVKGALRFSTLPKGTGSEFIFNMLMKSAYRTSYDSLAEQGWDIHFESPAAIRRRFIDGELDVCTYIAGPGTYLLPAFERVNMETVLLPVEEEMLDLMTHQFMTISYVIEKGDYENVDEEILTLGDYSCLVARRSLPDGVVRMINYALWENRRELALTSKDILSLTPRYAVAGQSAVHPASMKFWTSPEMQEAKKKEKGRP